MAHPELTLTVQSDRRVRAASNDGAEALGDFALTDLDANLVDLFTDWLVRKKVGERRELELFGTVLYRALINGSVHTLFEQTRSHLPDGERLRLQLSVEANEFAGLPWEFLYGADDFLATANDLVLSRYIRRQTGRTATLKPDHLPLRVLLATVHPTDTDMTTSRPITEAIGKLQKQMALDLRVIEQPTRDDLLDTLLDFEPHVFHFVTQGRFDRDKKQGHIALVKSDGTTADWIDDRGFADFFEILKGSTRLVLLQHCESGTGSAHANFAELASQLIRNDVQAVIAMQYPITNLAAATFSTRFYQAVARGEPVDHAVQTARWRIRLAADEKTILLRDFGTPMLYMRAHDGIILPVAETQPAELPATPAMPASDPYTPYENGIRTLLVRLGEQHARYSEALVYQQRLLENVAFSRIYGETDNRRAERAEVVSRLNALSMAEFHVSFNDLCVTDE